MDRELISKIAQEAHTMGRIYEKPLLPINPAIEFDNVEKMIDRMLKQDSASQQINTADEDGQAVLEGVGYTVNYIDPYTISLTRC